MRWGVFGVAITALAGCTGSVSPAPAAWSVAVSVLGTGTGTVTCSGAPCPTTAAAGTSLAFTATPGPDASFAGWGGACAGTARTCALVVRSATSVTATFEPGTPPAATYWVSPSGAAAWAGCRSQAPLDGSAACSLATANANVAPGDFAYLRGGTYGTPIAPVRGGSLGRRITFKGSSGEAPLIKGTATAIALGGRSYVTIDGVTADGNEVFVDLRTADHVWILNSTLVNSSDTGGWPMGVKMWNDSQYHWLANNTIGHVGYMTANDDIGGVMNVGDWSDPSDETSHNLIENNLFYHGGHHVIEIAAKYNIFRNNTFHNENWTSCPRASTGNLCGNRDIGVYDDSLDSTWNLFEGNRFAFAGASIDDATGSTGASVRGPHNIVRRNLFYLNDGPGLGLYTDGTRTYDPSHAHVFHNVFYRNAISPLNDGDYRYNFALVFDNVAGGSAPVPITDVAVKNNLFYDNDVGDLFFYYTDPARQEVLGNAYHLASASNAGGRFSPAIPAANVQGVADPMFVNVNVPADVGHIGDFDFRLQAASPAIDRGVFLTATTSAGSGTIVPVGDAGYFVDGFGIADGDVIQLEGQTRTARIVSIDYATNRITVDAPLAWGAGQGVSLAYSGSAPDIGAYEWVPR